ncbi:sulfur carrier protein ThiS [Bacillus piscicola]|uniref:sulfur carrier protein ThiS n=1 Tax=Bacillus piscicola TaxID=1632684 RepID=UPI001F09385D|nr:sulfur carrier protein ThiS [Bacillus piscicola]
MKLTINGIEKQVPADLNTVSRLLTHLELGEKKAVIERNGKILRKDEHEQEPVASGDTIEIVHFVGGG